MERESKGSLLQIPDDLMPVGTSVASARDVNPIILPIGRFENQLIEIAMVLNPIKPAPCLLKIRVATVIVPGCIRGQWKLDISGLSESMLRGIGSTDLDVELVATIAGRDDNGATDEGAEGFEDFLAELLQGWNKLRGYTVVKKDRGDRSVSRGGLRVQADRLRVA